MKNKSHTRRILHALFMMTWALPLNLHTMESTLDTTSPQSYQGSTRKKEQFLSSDAFAIFKDKKNHRTLKFYHQGNQTTTIQLPRHGDHYITRVRPFTQNVDGSLYAIADTKEEEKENGQVVIEIDPQQNLRILPLGFLKAYDLHCGKNGKLYLLSRLSSWAQSSAWITIDPHTGYQTIAPSKLRFGLLNDLLAAPKNNFLYINSYDNNHDGEDSHGILVWNTQDDSNDLQFFQRDSILRVDSRGTIHVGENRPEGAVFIRSSSFVQHKKTTKLPLKKIEDLCLDAQDNTYILGYSQDNMWQLLKLYLGEDDEIHHRAYTLTHPSIRNHNVHDLTGRLLGISSNHMIYAYIHDEHAPGQHEQPLGLIVRLPLEKKTPEYIQLENPIRNTLKLSSDGTLYYHKKTVETDNQYSLQGLKADSEKPEHIFSWHKGYGYTDASLYLTNDGTLYMFDTTSRELMIVQKGQLISREHQQITNLRGIRKVFTFHDFLSYHETVHAQETLHELIQRIENLEAGGMTLSQQDGDALYAFIHKHWPDKPVDFYSIAVESMHRERSWTPYVLGFWIQHAFPDAFSEHPRMQKNTLSHYQQDLEKLQHTQKVLDALQYLKKTQKDWFHQRHFDELYEKIYPAILKTNLARAYAALTHIQDQTPGSFFSRYMFDKSLEQVRSSLVSLGVVTSKDEEADENIPLFVESIAIPSVSNKAPQEKPVLLEAMQNLRKSFRNIQKIDQTYFDKQALDTYSDQVERALFELSREQASHALKTLKGLLVDHHTDDHSSWLAPALDALKAIELSQQKKPQDS